MIYLDSDVIGPWVCEKAGGQWVKGNGQTIGLLKNGELVAGVIYEQFNGANVVCHIRGEPGWANRGYLATIFDYPFNQLKVSRITVPVNDNNEPSKRLVSQMGFELECVLKQANPSGGDILMHRLFRDECKYLEDKYASLVRHSRIQR